MSIIQGLRVDPRDTFRLDPTRHLILFDRLPARERSALEKIHRDDLYGVVRRRDGNGIAHTVGREAALLLYTLQEPGPLPTYLTQATDRNRQLDEVVRLVLDGILEVRSGDRYLTGVRAVERWRGSGGSRGRDSAERTFLSELSYRAVRYTANLGLHNPNALMAELYTHHRLPLTPRQLRRWRGAKAILGQVGLTAGSPLERRVNRRWRAQPQRKTFDWLRFVRRGSERTRGSGATYKLYISPLPDALPETIARLVEALPATGAHAFKLGGDAAAILRPDKLVVYFEDFETLFDAAQLLEERLDGLPVHGVPFTSEVGCGGLLSWGFDPPADQGTHGRTERESWRMWLVTRLAVVLADIAGQDGEQPAWELALERLRCEGIDVDDWKPSLGQWSNNLASLSAG